MTSNSLYLLDTCVLFHLIRGQKTGLRIDAEFQLQKMKQRPLICVVSQAELKVLAHRNNWGESKLKSLNEMLNNVVTVDINHPLVIDAYVELELFSQRHPEGSRNMGKNDLWIAATAKASGALLLTTDEDFSHLIPSHVQGRIISKD